jgi:photosystem II stability/assembly factor-like uncharacterized protein
MLPLAAQTPQAPYVWKNVIIRGGGFVSGIVFSPAQKGLVYARTDVGGAYRSDDAGEHWTPITDGFGREQSSYDGIESLAVDPTDASKVYLAAGMYSADWGGPAAILRSTDKGRTWKVSPLPLKMGGNDDGRNCGEKLAVDPNKPSVLYFGSRKAGLWRSTDSGATWAKVESFPVKDKVPGPWQQVGLTFVLFDQAKGASGEPTPSIYVGAAQAGASLYHSDDAGRTWQVVAGLPQGMFPSHAKAGSPGLIYFSFIDNIGPNGITNGAVMKYTVAGGKWQDVSPVQVAAEEHKFGFGGLGVDAEHPDTLMVTTLDRWWPSDNIYRSTDAGKHWRQVNSDAVFSAPNEPWVYWHRDKTGGTGWMSDIEIDPFNPDKVMYTTGEGIWGSADVTLADRGKPTHWGFPNDGLEETVPITLISPTEGAHLLSGVGDIGGFRHEDLTKSPRDGFFTDPQWNNTDSLDYASQNPNLVVRVGRGGGKNVVHGAYSLDNGVKWREFASEPPTSKYGAGHVAISADGAVVIWTPERGSPFWTDNMGKTWSLCAGLGTSFEVVSDRVNPSKFYSFDPKTGKLYESFDKGREFKERTEPVAPGGNHVSVAATPGFDGDIWIAASENLYHSVDSGATFSTIEGMHKVNQLGFGKAAPGSKYPAVYLAGKWKDIDALYRSDDAGKTWLRLNDQEHQFGWIGPITGDSRVYGRVYFGTGGRGVIYGDLVGAGVASQSGGTH